MTQEWVTVPLSNLKFGTLMEIANDMGCDEEMPIPHCMRIKKSRYSKYWIVPDVDDGLYVSHLDGFAPKYVININDVVSDLMEYDRTCDVNSK